MRIGILKAGRPAEEAGYPSPSYEAMIHTALGASYVYTTFDVMRGELPRQDSGIDGFVITGSASGVHDADPWIAAFKRWLTDLEPQRPLVGICFGHQIMADVYGGAVEACPEGWGIGLHHYRIIVRTAWMDAEEAITLPAAHRDQVARPPATAEVIASSEFCPYAVLAYRDRRAVSFQAHPEFDLRFTARVIQRCEKRGRIGSMQAEEARASLAQRSDGARVMNWIRRFLEAAGSPASGQRRPVAE